ncbi:MAG TPA: TetR/AcrR family transcriptional regulator [Acidimicrobiales bacterium]
MTANRESTERTVADGTGAEPDRTDAAARLVDLWHRWENPGRSAQRGLNLRRIAEAAIEIADADGLGAVSMARVAERLGYTTMALYRHVSGKDELLAVMAEAAFEPALEDIPAGTPWRAGLERWARAVLGRYLASPWLTDINPTGLNSPVQLKLMDQGLRLLAPTGLPYLERLGVLLSLSAFIAGHARLVAYVARTEAGEGAPMGTLMTHMAGSGQLPEAEAALAAGMLGDDDFDDFAFGLGLVLDGVERLLRRRGGATADGDAP